VSMEGVIGYPASLIQDAEDAAVFAERIKLRLPEAQHYLVDALYAHAVAALPAPAGVCEEER